MLQPPVLSERNLHAALEPPKADFEFGRPVSPPEHRSSVDSNASPGPEFRSSRRSSSRSPSLRPSGSSSRANSLTGRRTSTDSALGRLGTDASGPIWKLFADSKFRSRLSVRTPEAWMSREERAEHFGSKMDCVVNDKWNSLLRRKLFSMSRSAALSLRKWGRVEAVSPDDVEEPYEGASYFTASALRDDLEKKLQSVGMSIEWMSKPKNEQDEQYGYTHTSYLDSVARSNPILNQPSIGFRIKKMWKMLTFTMEQSNQPVAGSRQQAAGSRQQVAKSEQRAVGNEQEATTNEQKAADSEQQSVVNAQQLEVSKQEALSDEQEPQREVRRQSKPEKVSSTAGVYIPRDLYNKITCRIYQFFIPGVSGKKALEIASFMWDLDLKDESRDIYGHCAGLSYEGFHNLIIDVACSWCQDHTEKEYLKLLNTIQCVIVPAELVEQYSQLKRSVQKRVRRKSRAGAPEDEEPEIEELPPEAVGASEEGFPELSAGPGLESFDLQRMQQLLQRTSSPDLGPEWSSAVDQKPDGLRWYFSAPATSTAGEDQAEICSPATSTAGTGLAEVYAPAISTAEEHQTDICTLVICTPGTGQAEICSPVISTAADDQAEAQAPPHELAPIPGRNTEERAVAAEEVTVLTASLHESEALTPTDEEFVQPKLLPPCAAQEPSARTPSPSSPSQVVLSGFPPAHSNTTSPVAALKTSHSPMQPMGDELLGDVQLQDVRHMDEVHGDGALKEALYEHVRIPGMPRVHAPLEGLHSSVGKGQDIGVTERKWGRKGEEKWGQPGKMGGNAGKWDSAASTGTLSQCMRGPSQHGSPTKYRPLSLIKGLLAEQEQQQQQQQQQQVQVQVQVQQMVGSVGRSTRPPSLSPSLQIRMLPSLALTVRGSSIPLASPDEGISPFDDSKSQQILPEVRGSKRQKSPATCCA